MCLKTKPFKSKKQAREFYKNPKIATRNISVYKLFRLEGDFNFDTLISPHKFFRYKYGKKYSSRFTCEIDTTNAYVPVGYIIKIYKGIHSYRKKDYTPYPAFHERVIKCVIPKGAKYYLSGDGTEIVSNKLIIPQKKS